MIRLLLEGPWFCQGDKVAGRSNVNILCAVAIQSATGHARHYGYLSQPQKCSRTITTEWTKNKWQDSKTAIHLTRIIMIRLQVVMVPFVIRLTHSRHFHIIFVILLLKPCKVLLGHPLHGGLTDRYLLIYLENKTYVSTQMNE